MFEDIASKVLVGIAVSIGVGLVYWLKKRWVDPAAKVLRALPTLISDIADIRAEVRPENGPSLKVSVQNNQTALDAVQASLTIVEAKQRGLVATLARATFETDESFNWVDCNMAMERLTGLGFSHLERKRWVSRIHEEDRADVMQEIAHAVADRRGATATFRFVKTLDGEGEGGDTAEIIRVRLEATPIFNRAKPDHVICWSGSLSREEERRSL